MPKGENWIKHGLCRTPEYTTWCLIKSRCHNKNHPRFLEWGGRGIVVCEKWRDNFLEFYKDMGKKPTPKHSIDRINNDDGYNPHNCRWASPEEQASNRKGFVREIKYNGITKNLSEWARHFNINREMLKWRVDAGWDLPRAFFQSSSKII